jgi:methoxymalonate biosynthesis acyl carrier protein
MVNAVKDPKEQIRSFIGRHLRMEKLADADDIFATGYVNSLFAIQLVAFVESQFGLRLENDDLQLSNFQSVNAIASLVESKRGLSAKTT